MTDRNAPAAPAYPENEKAFAMRESVGAIRDFVALLKDRGIVFARWETLGYRALSGEPVRRLMPTGEVGDVDGDPKIDLILEALGVDVGRYWAEKSTMLEDLRAGKAF